MSGVRTAFLRVAKRLLGERYGAVKHGIHVVGHRLARRDDELRLADRFVREQGTTVAAGPFKGMRYLRTVSGHKTAIPKLLGCYESEIHEAVERLLARPATQFIDIGSAEGYYAVGCALRRPDAQSIAFDGDPVARFLVRRMAALNGVAVDVRSHCSHDALSVLRDDAVVICDCEGFEKTLLDPAVVPALRSAAILVELHDLFDDSITPTIRNRFEATHALTFFATRGRDADDFPQLRGFSASERALALSEFRPAPMQWVLMIPTDGASSEPVVA